MVRCTIHLYFPPGWELGEDADADPVALAKLGDSLRARCRQAAGVVGALAGRGWRCSVSRYEIVAVKDCDRATAMLDFLRSDLDPVRLGFEEVDGPDGDGREAAISS